MVSLVILPIHADLWLKLFRLKKVKVSICIAHLAYNASNALFVTNPSRQLHGHHVQPADTG